MNTRHPSYQPGTEIPADGSYLYKPATLAINISLGQDGQVYVNSFEDTDPWTRVLRKGGTFPYLEGRDPDPVWVLLKTGLS